jgi:tRNA (guanine-N7-)-methyltransferase
MTTVDERRPASQTRIRTYQPRRGRLSGRHFDALARLWPRYGVEPTEAISPQRPLVLEIGFGMGGATAAMAAADPARDYLAVEIHTAGIANLLALIEQHGLTNVRVVDADALEFVRDRLPEASLDAIHVFFPDPWPKLRHRKRRLIQPTHVALLASRLRSNGILHCATDDAGYAAAMLATLSAEPSVVNTRDGFADRPAYRASTKFELRATLDGRDVFDLIFTKR